MQYPLELSFKILAFAPQIYVRDAAGREVCYVKQQLFKLKEKIRVYADSSMRQLLAEISADRIIDFSARYTFTDPSGAAFGSVQRKGLKSLWRSHYEVEIDGRVEFTLREANPWSKMMDGIFGEIPLVGLLSGYLFHPRYHVLTSAGDVLYTLRKRAAFLEGRFVLEKTGPHEGDITIVMAVLMMILLERDRG